MTMDIRDINKTRISSEEEIHQTTKFEKEDRKEEDRVPEDTGYNLQGEDEEDEFEVFEILKLLLS